MELTGRQQAFLQDFLDLYQATNQPLHYTLVAERLGVGKITAYDMLRLLEEKGLVCSEYVLSEHHRGAGRSSIVFYPTARAADVLTELVGEDWEQLAWDDARNRILAALQTGRAGEYEQLVNDILVRVDEQRGPLIFAGQIAAAAILVLRALLGNAGRTGLREQLGAAGFPDTVVPEALVGLAVGLSFAEQLNRQLTTQLLHHMEPYQLCLAKLSQRAKRQLSQFSQEVWKAVDM